MTPADCRKCGKGRHVRGKARWVFVCCQNTDPEKQALLDDELKAVRADPRQKALPL